MKMSQLPSGVLQNVVLHFINESGKTERLPSDGDATFNRATSSWWIYPPLAQGEALIAVL